MIYDLRLRRSIGSVFGTIGDIETTCVEPIEVDAEDGSFGIREYDLILARVFLPLWLESFFEVKRAVTQDSFMDMKLLFGWSDKHGDWIGLESETCEQAILVVGKSTHADDNFVATGYLSFLSTPGPLIGLPSISDCWDFTTVILIADCGVVADDGRVVVTRRRENPSEFGEKRDSKKTLKLK